MNAEAILKKIDENAKDVSSALLNEARLKAAQIQHDSHVRVEHLREAGEQQAAREAAQMRRQMESISELEFKKFILEQKRSIMDAAFALAADKLKALPAEQVREKVVSMILAQAEGGNLLHIGEHCSDWFNDEVFTQINAVLAAQGKAPLQKSPEPVAGCTGAVLVMEGIAINCTLEAVLEYIRSDIEHEVAAKLFQSEG